MYIPSNYIKNTETTIYNKNVCSDIKLSALGDIHISKIVPLKVTDSVLYAIDAERSDYICFLGDIVDLPSDLMDFTIARQVLDFIKSLASIAPVFIVLGSHDFIDLDFQEHYYDEFWSEVASLSNVYLLNDKIYQNKEILFMGYLQKYLYWYPCGKRVGNERREDLNVQYEDLLQQKELYTNLPHHLPKVAMLHSPEFYKDEKTVSLLKDYDLILCGHFHNGLLPFFVDRFYSGNRGLISPKREVFPKVSRGIMPITNNSLLLINGGISKIQYSASKKLWFYNSFCYRHLDTIIFTGEEERKGIKRTLRKCK